MRPRKDHPLCAGVAPFTLQDEHYFMALDDPGADVFLTTSSVNGEQPGAWRREVGKGVEFPMPLAAILAATPAQKSVLELVAQTGPMGKTVLPVFSAFPSSHGA